MTRPVDVKVPEVLTRSNRYGAVVTGAILACAAAGLYYHSFAAGLLFAPLGLLAPRWARVQLERWRRDRLKHQFKDALQSISSSLSAGRSVDNAILSVPDDLRMIYPDPTTEIRLEFERIGSRMRNGDSMEQCLASFGERARIEDIRIFADVVSTAKRSGGDLVAAVRGAAEQLGDKMEVERELAVILARKRFEARMMLAAPFVFILFLSITAPDYMAPLYSAIGYVLLTVTLAVHAGCYYMADRIMAIEL
jgi:tight adherence protein B